MPMRVNKEARAANAAVKRAETRERLLDAALKVVAEKGVEDVSIEDFTAAAGMSRASFYNYYATVPELLLALNVRIQNDINRRLAGVRADVPDPVMRMAAILHRMWAAFAEDPEKGWVATRIEAMAVRRRLGWDDEFASLYRRGVEAGRFVDGGYEAARTITFGALRMAVRDLYVGVVDFDHAIPLVAGILRACGLPAEEAERISREQAAAARAP